MKIGILAAGDTPRSLVETYGHYPEMFEGLLAGRGYAWRVFDAPNGDYPAAPEDCDAYLVTGAAAGVYDPDPWIAELLQFLRAARGRAKLVGVCFGHQAMAQAFGAEVIKSPKGWGIGEHDYRVVSREPFMDSGADFRLPASHQDQVVSLPPGAELMAASDFTPFAALAWRDQPAISMQPHPEFDPAYAAALIEARRGKVYAQEEADRAVASFAGPDDRARVGGWINAFLRGQ